MNLPSREFLAASFMASLTMPEYAFPISTKNDGRTIELWSEFSSRKHTEYVTFIQATDVVLLTCLAAIINLPKPYRLFAVRPLLSITTSDPTDLHRATMDSGPNGDSFLAPRMLPDPDEGGDYHWPSYCKSTNTQKNIQQIVRLTTTIVAHPIRIRTTPSLWCSAACPTGTKALFAVGTSDGLHTLEGFGSHWMLSQKPFPNERLAENEGFRRHGSSSHASVSAVEWLSSDVIVSGLRNSTVFLHDLRSGGSATRLQHPHSVTKIRKVDQYRLVVGGHNSVSDLSSECSVAVCAHTFSGWISYKCTTSASRQMASSASRNQTHIITHQHAPTLPSQTIRPT